MLAHKASTDVVNPQKLADKFKDAQKFNKKLRALFPDKVNEIDKIRIQTAQHQIKLTNILKDCELIGQNTRANALSCKNLLEMRVRTSVKLTNDQEAKYWTMIIKKLTKDLNI